MAIRKAGNNQAIPFDVDEQGRAVFVAQEFHRSAIQCSRSRRRRDRWSRPCGRCAAKSLAENSQFRLRFHPDGRVQSIVVVRSGQEIVNDKGELPFNQLLRIEGQEPSIIASPIPPVD